MDKWLYILRGISGCGKSALAKQLVGNGVICSADLFFTTPSGEYRFLPDYLGDAHRWCKSEVTRLMISDISPIVVDNTNTSTGHVNQYIVVAKRFGYEVRVIEPNTPWHRDPEECFRRNCHKVPLDIIQKQLRELTSSNPGFPVELLALS